MKSSGSTQRKHPERIQWTWDKIALIMVVIASTLLIVASLVISIVLDPGRRARVTLERLSSEYYSDYLYSRLIGTNASAEDALKSYSESGIPTIYLRQILWYDGGKNRDRIEVFANERLVCDTNGTSVKFYPEPPYGKNDFRAEYQWSCDKDLNL